MTEINNSEKKRAGRKPGKDNKMPITLYIEQSVISKIGKGWIITGKDKAREEAVKAIYELANSIVP